MMTWRPAPFVKLCAALHVVAVIYFLFAPGQWLWILFALFILHCLIATLGLLPRSNWLGDNLSRLPADSIERGEVAITIDDGPDPVVTPQILAILQSRGVKATFFCIGERAAAYPDVCRAIAAAGHDVENHGQRHRKHTSIFGLRGWQREVGEAQATLSALTGSAPAFYRPIAGLRNPLLDPVLQRMGLRLASWTRRGYDTQVCDPDKVYSKLTYDLAPGDIFLLHDGNAARMVDGRPIIVNVLPRLLDTLAARNLITTTLRQACKRV